MANVCAVSFLFFSLVPWRWSCRRSCRRFCRQVRRRCVACRRSYRISWCRQPGHVVGIIMVDILIQYVFIGFGFVSDLVAVFFAVGLFVTSVFSSLLCSVLSSVFVCHLSCARSCSRYRPVTALILCVFVGFLCRRPALWCRRCCIWRALRYIPPGVVVVHAQALYVRK